MTLYRELDDDDQYQQRQQDAADHAHDHLVGTSSTGRPRGHITHCPECGWEKYLPTLPAADKALHQHQRDRHTTPKGGRPA